MAGKGYQASAKGLTAICFNRHFEPKEEPGKRLSSAQWAEWEEQNWQKRVYKNSDGKLIVPQKAIRKSYIEATRFSEMKPPGRMKSWRPLIENCLMVENDMALEYDQKRLRGWSDYVKRGTGAVLLIRPVIDLPWTGGFKLMTFDDAITFKVIDHLSEIVGRVLGWMEARKYMGFGRSEITITEV